MTDTISNSSIHEALPDHERAARHARWSADYESVIRDDYMAIARKDRAAGVPPGVAVSFARHAQHWRLHYLQLAKVPTPAWLRHVGSLIEDEAVLFGPVARGAS